MLDASSLFYRLFLLSFLFLGTIHAEAVRGILLLHTFNDLRREPNAKCGAHAVGIPFFESHSSYLKDLDAEFLNHEINDALLKQIREKLASFYEEKKQPLVIISIPKQTFSEGIVQVVIQEGKLGDIRCKGNKHFTGTELMSYIRAKPGESLDWKQLLEDVSFMNQSPFRRTDAVIVPGSRPGLVDLDLVTIDRSPYRVYVGADNTGTVETMRNRLFFGMNLGKTVIKDSEVSYQYTMSPNSNKFIAQTGLVRVPLPWRHILQVYGGYTRVRPSTYMEGVKEKGVAWQVDLRYRIPIFEDLEMLQQVILGYDYKEVINTTYGSVPSHGVADINQFMVGYEAGLKWPNRKLSLNMELFGNPSGITNHNDAASYRFFRYRARPSYVYFRFAHSFSQVLPGEIRFSYDLTGQLASQNLLPSEQFLMTGYNAVRGFDERVLSLDNAAILSVSFESPHVSPAKFFGWKRKRDELYIMAFFDGGVGKNHTPAPGTQTVQSLGAAGPGIRYQVSEFLSTRLDYGLQIWHSGFDTSTVSRYDFGVILSY